MKLVWTFNYQVNMSLEETRRIFFDLRPGEFTEYTAPFLVQGKGNLKITYDLINYIVDFADGHREFINIDTDENRIAVQGERWYRGEYTLTPAGDKTNIQLQVFNLADKEWVVSLKNTGAERKHQMEFISLCKMAERKHE